ncbi:MAG TPA: F0F1 ATP synthase subunit A [Deltaproteobacteria bacterium]|nr:F0F1 ATP synthase subunit A [Deltaproteobacteria bacterium]
MEHPYLFLVKFFEWIGLGHFAHEYPHVLYSWLVMVLLIVSGSVAVKNLNIIPTKTQNFFEIILEGLENFMIDITGEEGRWFFPVLGTVFLYIFACNLTGLIPGFFPPTASYNTTLSCAIVIFCFTHIIGIKYHGVKYYKHFIGPVWWLIPIMLPIELISHFSRVLSLSMRLFGNMSGHELVLAIFFGLAGAFFVPLPIMAMGIFVAFVQAFVFFMLSIMYFTGAMEHAH